MGKFYMGELTLVDLNSDELNDIEYNTGLIFKTLSQTSLFELKIKNLIKNHPCKIHMGEKKVHKISASVVSINLLRDEQATTLEVDMIGKWAEDKSKCNELFNERLKKKLSGPFIRTRPMMI